MDTSKKDFYSTVKAGSKRISKAVAATATAVASNTRDAVVSATEKVSTAIDEKKLLQNSSGRRSLMLLSNHWKAAR